MDLNRIHQKVTRIKQLDPHEQVFNFLPPATEEELVHFEKQFGVTLPPDFRTFVKTIANGIEHRDSIYSIIRRVDFLDHFHQAHAYNPEIEFPLTKRAYYSDPDDADHIDRKYDTHYPFETDYFLYDLDACTNGQIDLLGTGCGCFYFLVVNGKEYGNIWCNNYMSNSEILPEFDRDTNQARLNFEEWINRQLDIAMREWFGNKRAPEPIVAGELSKEVVSDSSVEMKEELGFWSKLRRLF